MENLTKWLKGKKTYIVAAATVILGALQGLDVFAMPEWGWAVLIGLFGVSLRAGVNKVADTVKKG